MAAVALAAALAPLCPSPVCSTDDLHCNTSIVPREGLGIPCHAELLRARCPGLSIGVDRAAEVNEDSEVIYALLRWVYCEAVAPDLTRLDKLGVATRLVELAESWGLRDIGSLKARLAPRRMAVRRVSGTLAEDVLRAYDDDVIGGRLVFRAIGVDVDEDDAAAPELPGPWCALVRSRSSYFDAMLSGAWAESRGGADTHRVPVSLRWPREPFTRLLRFLHGAEFVRDRGDLEAAVECAKFFGVPALFASVCEWISDNLQVEAAPELWRFVDGEPMLAASWSMPGHEDVVDADAACFDYHIRHFQELTLLEDHEETRDAAVPLHELSPNLLRRLLASGLVDMSTSVLQHVVGRFVQAHIPDKNSQAHAELLESLRPPAVLFNRQNRAALYPTGDVTAASFV